MSIRFTLLGVMVSKKNRWRVGKGGQVYIPGDVQKELDDFLIQLKGVKNKNRLTKPFEGKLRVEVMFSGKDNYKKDVDNMTTTLFDLLQKAEFIKNDKEIDYVFASKFEEGENKCDVVLKNL